MSDFIHKPFVKKAETKKEETEAKVVLSVQQLRKS